MTNFVVMFFKLVQVLISDDWDFGREARTLRADVGAVRASARLIARGRGRRTCVREVDSARWVPARQRRGRALTRACGRVDSVSDRGPARPVKTYVGMHTPQLARAVRAIDVNVWPPAYNTTYVCNCIRARGM